MKPSFVIIGLGNPGKDYAKTRHNAGFMALDFLAEKFGATKWEDKQKFLCVFAEANIEGKACLLVKPTTYMNRSGECVRKLVEFYKLDPKKQVLIIVDDIDIPLGTSRYRESGGPGTHNGMKSLVDTFGEGFPRYRIGIGQQPDQQDLATWVLSAMTTQEREAISQSFEELSKAAQKMLIELEG